MREREKKTLKRSFPKTLDYQGEFLYTIFGQIPFPMEWAAGKGRAGGGGSEEPPSSPTEGGVQAVNRCVIVE